MEKVSLICHSTEFLSESSLGEDIGCVPGLVLGKPWIRDENGRMPNSELFMGYLMRQETNTQKSK